MFDVLIVDDEPIARTSLKYLIDWQEYGFQVKAEAADGREALRLMQEGHFSLVLTDIRMPVMSGLDMIAALREFADTEVVILSGYDDFNYARQGLRLGVREYLLKPVDEEDLVRLLRRLSADLLDKQLLEKRNRYNASAGRDHLLRRLAHGQIGRQEAQEQLRMLGLASEEPIGGCLLVEMDFVYGSDAQLSERDEMLKRFAVRNILEELCAGKGYVFEDSEDRFGLLLFNGLGSVGGSGSRQPDLSELRAFAETVSRSVAQYAKETVTIGLGRPNPGDMSIRCAYREAEEALDGKFLSGAGSILETRRTLQRETEGPAWSELARDVLEAVRHSRRGDAFRALERMWESLRDSQVTAGQAKLHVLELMVQLSRLVKEQGANHSPVFDHSLGDYDRVMASKTVDELHAFCEKKCTDVLQLLQRIKELRPNKIVEDVKRIIQEQYAGNVSLRSVSLQIYMNPNYLGKLFKASTDQSFNDYLLQVRMEKAKELLLHTDLKVYEIAQMVGYGELDWFYKRFKAYTGVSASEFRAPC